MDAEAFVLAQARAGNREAFRTLVERHSRAVFRVAYRITGNEADAEDVVQDTFIRAYTELKKFEARSGFGTWLHRIAANCAIDLIRRRPRHVVTDEEEAEPLLARLASSGAWAGARGRRPADAGADRHGARSVDAARTRGVHAAAPGAAVDRGNQRDARPEPGRDETQHLPRRGEDAPGAGPGDEDRSMTHVAEDHLIAFVLDDVEPAERQTSQAHLEQCEACRAEAAALRETLEAASAQPVPERGDDYGAAVWRASSRSSKTLGWRRRARRRGAGGSRPRRCWSPSPARSSPAGCRVRPRRRQQWHARFRRTQAPFASVSSWPRSATTSIAPSETLTEIVNAERRRSRGHLGRAGLGPRSARRQQALSAVRARRGRSASLSQVLDELEPVLLDIVHSPVELSADEFHALRSRIEDRSLVFKLRVTGADVRARQQTLIHPGEKTS